MKKLLLLFSVFFCFASHAQQGTVILEWTDNTQISYGDYQVKVPAFKSENYNYDNYKKAISFAMKVPVSAAVASNSLQITNVSYEPIQQSQLGDLRIASIPAAINATIKSINARDKFYALISLSPIIKDASGFKRIKSFTYAISGTSRPAPVFNNVQAITNSIFATGDLYRFYVEKSGVYKLSKSFLQSLGLSGSVDPKKIKIYGNGGRMIPMSNAVSYPYDPEENAIQVVGESDGTFDSGDYVLFYAEGVDNWNEESQTHNNLYGTRSYYYVTANGGDGKRIQAMDPLTGSTATTNITTFDDYQYHEKDLNNIARLGRRWFGEQFGVSDEQTFNFTFPNIVTSSPIKISVFGGAAAFTTTSLTVQANNQNVGTLTFGAISLNSGVDATYSYLPATASFPAAEDVTIKVNYNNGGVPSSKGFLDWIILRAKRNLTGYGKQFRFEYDDAATITGVGQFQISNASGISQVWDITDIYNVAKTENNGQAAISFKANLGEVRKYIAIDPADYYSPLKESKARVANQDIKGTIFTNAQGQFQDVDYIIVTPANLHTAAEKLAAFHRSYSGLNVKVLDLQNIYEEFGSGKQDIGAIRNLVKYVYENASSASTKIKYLNLFGDASFDFQDRISNNSNIVPIYQAMNGRTSGEASFATDDFFGMMDADEGLIDYFNTQTSSPQFDSYTYNFGGIDVAVGRMIANDARQADELVTKVIDYHDLKSYGSWRNNLVLISDDSDKPSDHTLQENQNSLADEISTEKPFFNVEKILLDSYEQETSAGGNRYPKARQDLFNAFEKGALIFNYLGHGGEDGLSGERIWEKSDGQNLQNKYRYPLFITITCEFSRFDNPFRPTAGEYTYWNARGGAISMITTIRSIGQFTAEVFNSKLSEYLLFYQAGQGNDTSIAESLREAKNAYPNSSTNVVTFLGDPAMRLAIPKPKIRLTAVNGQPVTGAIPDLQSLGFVTLTGEVTDEFNTPLTTYNGELSATIFDKPLTRSTLNNDNNAPPMSFSILGETIFRGNASVNNGQFQFGFVVPRDIRIAVGNGRISFYAKRNQILLDKTGYDTTIKVGGINQNAEADNIGPTVKLYMNDLTFISGGITNESPIFLAYLEDEHGINTASGIGHDIVAILDGNESSPYILNDYYETELNNYKKGHVRFPFRNLAKGLHTITFKAWDVYNNPVTAEIQFVVVGDEGVTLTNVLNYPNPFVNYTQFWFTHNRPFEPLDVQVQVMTVTGKVVWTKNQTVTTDGFLSREITWDGRDDFGDRIGKGVYIYKLTVRSTVTNTKTEKFEKLVIL
ncbi:MAG: type IX secretion system sortase PorU [Flavobacterium sp.]|nr:MAG: type IX secretion system sortase PorU [Flavobacterium sp.]